MQGLLHTLEEWCPCKVSFAVNAVNEIGCKLVLCKIPIDAFTEPRYNRTMPHAQGFRVFLLVRLAVHRTKQASKLTFTWMHWSRRGSVQGCKTFSALVAGRSLQSADLPGGVVCSAGNPAIWAALRDLVQSAEVATASRC